MDTQEEKKDIVLQPAPPDAEDMTPASAAPEAPSAPAAPAEKRRRGLPLPIYMVLGVLEMELTLLLGGTMPLTLTTVLCFVLFDGSFALLLSLLCGICKREWVNCMLTAILLLPLSVFFCVQYFCNAYFSNYMSISSLTAGAGGVADDFMDVIVELVLRGFGMLLLFFLPLLLLPLLYRLRLVSAARSTALKRAIAAALAVLGFLGGYLAVMTNETAKSRYAATYDYDLAVSTFGLLTGTRLDLQYAYCGNPESTQFIPVPQEPAATLPPTTVPALPAGQTTQPLPPPPPEYGYNRMELDFSALAAAEPDETVAAIHSYLASLTISRQNEYTGLFAGKNLILITAEAFSRELIDEDLTPTLYRLATKGINFTDFYQPAWGGSTSTGEYSVLTGLIPTDGVGSMRATPGKNLYFTLGNQLQRLSYTSFAYHNHTYDYYMRDRTHRNMGYSEYLGIGNGLEDKIVPQWPESDVELMQATVDDYIGKQPFSIYYMTVSGHANYYWGANAMSKKNRDAVQELDVSEGVKAYYAANLELEYAMTYLIDRLEQAGIADDTVIVMTADHYPYGLESNDSPGYRNALEELYGYSYRTPWEQDHNALIIWSGCLEDSEPIVVDTPVYSLDIVPTVSNLFGLDYDSRLLIGRDVFSEEMPLVIWAERSWKTDKASYNAARNEYTVFPGYEDVVDEAYYERVNAIVRNKFAFSQNVLETDYYCILFGEDTAQ